MDAAYGENKKYLEPLRSPWQGANGIAWLCVAPFEEVRRERERRERRRRYLLMANLYRTFCILLTTLISLLYPSLLLFLFPFQRWSRGLSIWTVFHGWSTSPALSFPKARTPKTPLKRWEGGMCLWANYDQNHTFTLTYELHFLPLFYFHFLWGILVQVVDYLKHFPSFRFFFKLSHASDSFTRYCLSLYFLSFLLHSFFAHTLRWLQCSPTWAYGLIPRLALVMLTWMCPRNCNCGKKQRPGKRNCKNQKNPSKCRRSSWADGKRTREDCCHERREW